MQTGIAGNIVPLRYQREWKGIIWSLRFKDVLLFDDKFYRLRDNLSILKALSSVTKPVRFVIVKV